MDLSIDKIGGRYILEMRRESTGQGAMKVKGEVAGREVRTSAAGGEGPTAARIGICFGSGINQKYRYYRGICFGLPGAKFILVEEGHYENERDGACTGRPFRGRGISGACGNDDGVSWRRQHCVCTAPDAWAAGERGPKPSVDECEPFAGRAGGDGFEGDDPGRED